MSSTTSAQQLLKQAISANEFNFSAFGSRTRCHFVDINKMLHHLGIVTAMVRNAGQLPQPFWLGVACGGGSCGAARCPART